jgi:hypothetical protein
MHCIRVTVNVSDNMGLYTQSATPTWCLLYVSTSSHNEIKSIRIKSIIMAKISHRAETSRPPHSLDTQLTVEAEVASLMRWQSFTSVNISGIHFG